LKKKKSVCFLCKVPFVCLFVCFFEREEEEEEEQDQNKTRKKSSLIIERKDTKKQKEKKGRKELSRFSSVFSSVSGFHYCAFFERAFLCFWFLFLSFFVSKNKKSRQKKKGFAIHRFTERESRVVPNPKSSSGSSSLESRRRDVRVFFFFFFFLVV